MGTLEKISNWATGQGAKQGERSRPWAWVTGLVVAAVAAIALGVAHWRQRKIGKELAKLKHEKDLEQRTKENLVAIEAVNITSTLSARLRKEIVAIEVKIAGIDAMLDDVEKEREIKNDQIEKLSNWRDVDRFLGDGS